MIYTLLFFIYLFILYTFLFILYLFFFIFISFFFLTIPSSPSFFFFFLNDPAPPEIYPLPLPDPFPIPSLRPTSRRPLIPISRSPRTPLQAWSMASNCSIQSTPASRATSPTQKPTRDISAMWHEDRESTRLNSSHHIKSYALLFLEKKTK